MKAAATSFADSASKQHGIWWQPGRARSARRRDGADDMIFLAMSRNIPRARRATSGKEYIPCLRLQIGDLLAMSRELEGCVNKRRVL